jgi:hypothetical protein
MLRRSLLAGIGAATAALPTLAASPIPHTLAFESYFKGVSVAQRSACSTLQVGQQVQLCLQPQRRFDPRSIAALDVDGNVLGYLPGPSTRHLSVLLEQRWRATATVVSRLSGSQVPIVIELSPQA